MNKIDLLLAEDAAALVNECVRSKDQAALSAVTGEGACNLLDMVEGELTRQRKALDVTVPLQDGETIAWLYRRGEVLGRTDGEADARFSVLLDQADTARLEKRGFALRRAAE